MLDFARSKGVLADSGNFVARKSLARNSAQIPEIPVPFQRQILKREFGGSNHAAQAAVPTKDGC
jgi:hypothetical protein